MVGPDGGREVGFLVGADAGGHVGLTVVVEGFAEFGDGPVDVAEVGKGDVAGKFSDASGDVVSRRGESALAVAELVGGAGIEVEDTVEGLVVDDDTVLTVEIGEGWIVGVKGEGDTVVFGDGGDFCEEVGEIVPELFGGGGIGWPLGTAFHLGQVELGHEGAAALFGGE